jgi:transposase
MEFKTIAVYRPSAEEVERLHAMWREDPSHVVRNRAHATLLLFEKKRSFADVADIFGVHENTVRNWAERWTSLRIDGLRDLPGRGPKPLLDDAEKDWVVLRVAEEPRSLKAALPKTEAETGKRPSLDTLRDILKRRGKSWKRMRKIPKGEPTPEQAETGRAEIAELKALAADGEIALVYFDAAGFSLDPAVPSAWQDRGRAATLGIRATKSRRIEQLGFLDPAANALTTFEQRGVVDSQVVIRAMDGYCEDLAQPTVAVLDNAPVNTSAAVQAKRSEWEKRGLTLYYLPPYSPQLNLIEIVWRKVKHAWLPTWAYASLAAMEDALRGIFNSFGTEYKIEFSL